MNSELKELMKSDIKLSIVLALGQNWSKEDLAITLLQVLPNYSMRAIVHGQQQILIHYKILDNLDLVIHNYNNGTSLIKVRYDNIVKYRRRTSGLGISKSKIKAMIKCINIILNE
tara:strand:- start:580 stop:924 length:345 start_codon:yes stop_codon:yes gene_type:complete